MNKRAWTLLAISFSGNEYLSPAQLQKGLFVFKEKNQKAVGHDFYEFIPYNYGPFCKEIYTDTESLVSESLVKFGHPLGESWKGYLMTEKGKEYLESIKNQIPQEDQDYLAEIINWTRSLTFRQLLRVIYKEFPHYKINSVFSES